MENHPAGNARIKQPSKDIPLIIGQAQHIDAFFLHVVIKVIKQALSTQHIVVDCQLRILLLEIFLDTHQLDLVPRTFLGIVAKMDERYLK